jgi:hypothetical protein
MKVATPARECVEIDGLSGQRYNFRNGIADVPDRDAKAIVKFGGFIPSMSGTTRAGLGYRCGSCGFGCYFSTCGRCGEIAVKEIAY